MVVVVSFLCFLWVSCVKPKTYEAIKWTHLHYSKQSTLCAPDTCEAEMVTRHGPATLFMEPTDWWDGQPDKPYPAAETDAVKNVSSRATEP